MTCPYCGSTKVSKNGTRRNKYTVVQLLLCTQCNKSFSVLKDTDYTKDSLVDLVIEKKKSSVLTKQLKQLSTLFDKQTKDLETLLEKVGKSSFTLPKIKYQKTNKSLIIQLSDLHLSEVVNEGGNKYNFNMATERLLLFAKRIKDLIKFKCPVYLCLTGDIFNSDRRPDEYLNNENSRSETLIKSVGLLERFIKEIATIGSLTVISVSGNESRMNKDLTYTSKTITDNFDWLLIQILKMRLSGITVISSNELEYVLKVHNSNILLLHGLNIKANNVDKSISQTISRYATKGIILSYIIFGHIHSTNIGEFYARSGSLVGNNAYSSYALNLNSKPSQNIHIVHSTGHIDTMKIDLS